MSQPSERPIGIFDSGLGGLTVVREIRRQLPEENILYVGDTARVPYGTKSPETIRRYALEIAFFLLQKKVKMIVVACNSASAVALRVLKNLSVPVLGVIDPGARSAVAHSRSKRIGVIGTYATVNSHAYKKAIKRLSAKAKVWESPCPLFVPLVEEGWINHAVTLRVGEEYLKPLLKNKIDALVLGCTHYPLLKRNLEKIVGKKVKLIDSAFETAKQVKTVLTKNKSHNTSKRKGKALYFVTDHPLLFRTMSARFLNEKTVRAKRINLGSI